MSAAQFLESLYGVLPAFFKGEDQLRALGSLPSTRPKLLDGLAEKSFSGEALAEMQKVMGAQSSDLFDVLAYVAFALALTACTRAERAAMAQVEVHQQFTDKQQAFVNFVLAQYVKEGVEELDAEKLTPLLRLRYRNAIADAFADLDSADQIRKVFVGFQRHLYSAHR